MQKQKTCKKCGHVNKITSLNRIECFKCGEPFNPTNTTKKIRKRV